MQSYVIFLTYYFQTARSVGGVPAMRHINVDTFERTFTLLVTRNPHAISVGRTARLNALFDDLRRSDPLRQPEETMELIWAIWIDHRDKRASHRMVAAVEAISAGARDLAKPILDSLVDEHPEWAEAWNKRATLAFMEKRDNDSIADIARTLELEPRHFGAILGFAQICLRNGRIQEAKAAFEIAMQLNPHIDGLRSIVDDLANTRPVLH
jgi:tetratricopeptide (TPR) repeat protein